ncbi:ABC transporter permease [Georgenia satyanarayanai]|uniref:ABC transporter permease n=1 Tax=Georgenia satyanarayanai TaxID=860221 RepID=UPI00203AB6AC|nr:ABC transporter permease [Georgenia satyanarayanai]MCM3659775.1 ABC transporter permease [Georgenia satyanarayanai]
MSTDATSQRTPWKQVVGNALSGNGALLGLVALVVLLSFANSRFLTGTNLLNVGIQASVIAILAFGMTFVIITAGIDLSVGSIAALSAIVTAWSATSVEVNPFLAVLLGMVVGALAGAVNGVMVAYGQIPAFVATLAMLSIARGLTLVIADGTPIGTPDVVTTLGSTIAEWLPVPIIVMAVMGLVAAVILNRTMLGRSMYAVGGNEEAARLSGLNVRGTLMSVYILAGLFAAVAGLVLSGRLSSAGPQAASGYELDAIAAVVIGGASLAGGVGKISGTFIGALVLAVIRNGLNLLNVNPFWQQVAIGVVIALAVLADALRRRRS